MQIVNGKEGKILGILKDLRARDMSEEEVNAWLIKWSPYVTFEANPVVNADQQLDALPKMVEIMKSM